jgi:LacI family transcriptional regulator
MALTRKVMLLYEVSTVNGRRFLSGVAKYSQLHGPWIFYREPPFYKGDKWQNKVLRQMKQWGVDGILAHLDIKKVQELIPSDMPAVISPYTNEDHVGFCTVVGDNLETGRMGAEHLLGLGFNHFAYCGYDNVFWSVDRGKGFAEKIEEKGFEVNFYHQPSKKSDQAWQNEQLILADWLKKLPKPIALMTCNDNRSQEILDACTLAEIEVPWEIAILGVDNDDLTCNLAHPPLSSVALTMEKAGFEAAEVLDKLMKGEKPEKEKITVLPTHIVNRHSTDVLAIKDNDVANAIRFIRNNAQRVIQINDVVEETSLSRRSLELRFRKVLGRSVLDEIRRVRINHVAKLLLETDLTVLQIEMQMGYCSPGNLSRYFHKQTGMSPVQYRKIHGLK